ncbi:hypothetical protein VN24_21915 [Paenibacillus beijingensis]|uniref:DUF5071 domain-containing protein n=1 Tax=Paenibacillus beijingensis TaxID=1126833 RepID=A0A0D5NRL3_9BACL|nr:hypothetical protein VN24_21915 [Paenibacillus beijingensis]
MDIRELIPKHKKDFESIEKLKTLDLEELKLILPELLEWLQDMNWPIAREIQTILLHFPEDLTPHIRRIFRTSDGEWKYWILYSLLTDLPKHILIDLKPDLERINNYPTEDEKSSDLKYIVEDLLQRLE